jgi:DNA-binding phage protein
VPELKEDRGRGKGAAGFLCFAGAARSREDSTLNFQMRQTKENVMAEEIVRVESSDDALELALEELSAGEALAMNCIMSGESMTAAAEAAGVSRQTLYQWMKRGKRLGEAVTIWKQEVATTARTRLLMMTDLATRNILEALKKGDVRVAMTLMQKLGILAPPAVGATQVEAVTERLVVRNREEEARESVRVRAASFVESWTEIGGGDRGTEEVRE